MLVLALCWASLSTTLSVNAQTIDSTTGNLINTGTTPTDTTSVWNNGVYVNQLCFQAGQPGNCGPTPSIRAASGNINFSYGTTDLNQIVNINRALAAGGSGVQLSGFNFGFTAKNGNGWDDGRQDYLAAYVKFYGSAGNQVANYDYSSQTNQRYNWTNFNFSETFATPQLASQYSTAQVGFVGRDNNFWAGNYGPEIMNVSFSLKYRVDPCSQNAAYSPNCAGFGNILTGTNVLPQPDAWSQNMYQAAAINVALQNGGIGAQVHGMKYSFDWYVGGQGCTDSFLFWCTGWADSNIGVGAKMTNKNGQVVANKEYVFSGYSISGHVEDKLLLPTTMNQSLLGNVSMQSWGWGDSYAGNFRTSLIYTPDPCNVDPLYSANCKGYAVAYAKNLLLGSTVASASAPTLAAPVTESYAASYTPAQTNSTPDATQSSSTTAAPPPPPPPAPAAQDPNQNPAVAQDSPSQPGPQQAGPAPTSPQPAGGPPPTATASAPPPSSGAPQAGPQQGGGSGPSKLAMSVVKSAQAKDQAVQQMAVQNAAKAFEGSMQSSQASSNAAINMVQDMSANSAVAAATFASQSTQTSIQTSQQFNQQQSTQFSSQSQQTSRITQQVQQQQDTQQVQVATYNNTQVQQAIYAPPAQLQQETQSSTVSMLKPPTPAQLEVQQQASSGTGLTLTKNPFAYNPLGSINTFNIGSSSAQTTPVYQPRLQERIMEVDTPQVQVASFGGTGKAGNILNDMMMQQRFETMQENIQTQTSSVNRNVQPNDLAGGVDIAAMATVPQGFNAYSFIMRDAAFYEPKEVYKNQKTVDNVRVLRGLTGGSDALHQRMVDSQYK